MIHVIITFSDFTTYFCLHSCSNQLLLLSGKKSSRLPGAKQPTRFVGCQCLLKPLIKPYPKTKEKQKLPEIKNQLQQVHADPIFFSHTHGPAIFNKADIPERPTCTVFDKKGWDTSTECYFFSFPLIPTLSQCFLSQLSQQILQSNNWRAGRQ